MANPIGMDGMPMERHHPGRIWGETVMIDKITHDLIHDSEREAVREVFKQDGLQGNPNAWSAKPIDRR